MSDFANKDCAQPPDSFTEDIRNVLEHLYDFPYLQTHPLARSLAEYNRRPNETAGQHLRRLLMDLIEEMNPGTEVQFRAPSARLYNLLHLHYVEGMVVKDAARELGLSLRQAYRDLDRGTENVAILLWQRVQPEPETTETEPSEPKALNDDVERLVPQYESVDLMTLLDFANQAVGRLAQQQNIQMIVHADRPEISFSTDRILARQVFTSLLSRVIQQSAPGAISVDLAETPDEVLLRVVFTLRAEADALPPSSAVLAQLVDRLGWRLEEIPGRPGTITLSMKKISRLLLVIDDNEGLVGLVKRYLDNSICQLASTQNPREGVSLAQQLMPDAIMLDVMMPEMDGWEVLQRLKANPQTKAIPVIVCSVMNDPGLALSLGAEICLPKPMNPENFLAALKKLNLL
jgi:CheY-like chemotaxis protein